MQTNITPSKKKEQPPNPKQLRDPSLRNRTGFRYRIGPRLHLHLPNPLSATKRSTALLSERGTLTPQTYQSFKVVSLLRRMVYKKGENIQMDAFNLKAYLKHFFIKNGSSSIRHDVVLQGFGRQHKVFFSELLSQFPQSSCSPVDLSQTWETVNEVALESQLAWGSTYIQQFWKCLSFK